MIYHRPLSVLIVDSYPDAAESTADVLSLFGHAVRAAMSAAEAIRAVEADPPDVVLLDTHVPGLDGPETLRRLLSPTGGKPPVVVAIGHGTDPDRAHAAACGGHLYLVKPVEPAFLIGLLRRFRETLVPDPPTARDIDVVGAELFLEA